MPITGHVSFTAWVEYFVCFIIFRSFDMLYSRQSFDI